MASTETAPAEPGAEGTGRGRRHRTVLLIVAVLAILGVTAVGWWWRRPGMFGQQGNTVFIYNPVGTTAWLDLARPSRKLEEETVTIHSVEPQVVQGRADIEVVACRTDADQGGVGAVRGSLDEYCAWHGDPEGATLRVDDQLLLGVHSDQPDQVVVKGVDVRYSYGWQRGSQVTGQTVRVRFGTKTVQEHLASR